MLVQEIETLPDMPQWLVDARNVGDLVAHEDTGTCPTYFDKILYCDERRDLAMALLERGLSKVEGLQTLTKDYLNSLNLGGNIGVGEFSHDLAPVFFLPCGRAFVRLLEGEVDSSGEWEVVEKGRETPEEIAQLRSAGEVYDLDPNAGIKAVARERRAKYYHD